MEEIDKPFRPKLDFFIAWALLAVAIAILAPQAELGSWYSVVSFVIVASLLGTFVLYGPVILFRQVIGSGLRGRFVLRVFLSIIVVAILAFGGFSLSGYYSESRASIAGFVFCAARRDLLELENRP
jgi:hypothetical protein